MDLVEEIHPGAFRVVDYKVFARRKSDSDILALYSAQLELYVGALHAILGENAHELSAILVQITPEGVFETPVPLNRDHCVDRATDLAARARKAIEKGLHSAEDLLSLSARPGVACRNCVLRSSCAEADTSYRRH
jgi:hypothetical protein